MGEGIAASRPETVQLVGEDTSSGAIRLGQAVNSRDRRSVKSRRSSHPLKIAIMIDTHL